MSDREPHRRGNLGERALAWACTISLAAYFAFSNGVHNYFVELKQALDKAVALVQRAESARR